ncbi:MAG: protoporphyrinogen oxidase [Rhodothermales bacterium]
MTERQQHIFDVAVVGGGITGLTLAYLLQKAGLDVSLLEKRNEAGGVIRTHRSAGFLFDAGPNSTLVKSQRVLDLVEELGLKEALCYASDQAENRYILKHGHLCKLPTSPPAFLKTNLLSARAKLRVLGELFVPRGPATSTETVADFVKRRLGPEFLDYVINPFVAGIYASDPSQLNLKATFPRLLQLEQDYGGLIRGAIRKRFEKKNGQVAAMPKARMISFASGMQALTAALVACLGSALQTGTTVTRVEQQGAGFLVRGQSATTGETVVAARRLILASPAYVTASLIEPLAPDAADLLARVPYAPVAVVYYGFTRAAVGHPLDGFGFLVPEKEQRSILGTLWNSSLFPGRAPKGHAVLTTFVGGLRQPDLPQLPDGALHDRVRSELDAMLGLSEPPVVSHIHRWPKAIPQYTGRHHAVVEAVEQVEARYPGLHVTGNFRGGVSVADCIANAYVLADDLLAHTT